MLIIVKGMDKRLNNLVIIFEDDVMKLSELGLENLIGSLPLLRNWCRRIVNTLSLISAELFCFPTGDFLLTEIW